MSKEAVDAVRVGIEDALNVFESLSVEEWGRPSGCTGWRVQDVAAHMGSNFKETADPSPPPPEPLPPMPAERLMDLLVEPRLDWTPEQVLIELRTYAPGLIATWTRCRSLRWPRARSQSRTSGPTRCSSSPTPTPSTCTATCALTCWHLRAHRA